LCISEETVKTHVGKLLAKLQAENRAQAIVHALKRGPVSLDELQQDATPGAADSRTEVLLYLVKGGHW
jgi:hypothetical protein